jgi:hypothetical protein
LRVIRKGIEVFPDATGCGWSDGAANCIRRRFAMNVGLIITFVFVVAWVAFVSYGLIRPFTHIHHDHKDVFHPPHLN